MEEAPEKQSMAGLLKNKPGWKGVALTAAIALAINANACNDTLLFKAREYETEGRYETARTVYWIASRWPRPFRQEKNGGKMWIEDERLRPSYHQALKDKDVDTLIGLDEIAPKSPIFALEAGNFLAERGEYERASRWLEHGLNQVPGDPDFRRVLAKCYDKMGKKDLAEHTRNVGECLKFY